ncbi:hypothetical protein N473_20935 [Pseudoalteromonas luteoviolacea CPMOR-1]|uniref:VWFA domain-containing protein n=1 Tax=Pseudoalteromonas luteoviolacea CPMOR-1 TaxID=1365248 RepID=A0A162AMV9_9GAMM|nr:hypothetical protein [Pseudoalteromonas luteoviolacea]KZN62011.1 hypothetical protein N473_20935 [Pseudoalteromonas luteoviolacea CPMOR-1]
MEKTKEHVHLIGAVIAFLLLAFYFVIYLYDEATKPKLNYRNCFSKEHMPKSHAFIFDITDPIDNQYIDSVVETALKHLEKVGKGEQVSIFAFTDSTEHSSAPVKVMCSLGTMGSLSEHRVVAINNYKNKIEPQFRQAITDILKKIKERPHSPILESLAEIAASADFQVGQSTVVHIFSDMRQNSDKGLYQQRAVKLVKRSELQLKQFEEQAKHYLADFDRGINLDVHLHFVAIKKPGGANPDQLRVAWRAAFEHIGATTYWSTVAPNSTKL